MEGSGNAAAAGKHGVRKDKAQLNIALQWTSWATRAVSAATLTVKK